MAYLEIDDDDDDMVSRLQEMVITKCKCKFMIYMVQWKDSWRFAHASLPHSQCNTCSESTPAVPLL